MDPERCDGVRGLLSAYADGELPPDRALDVGTHVARCAGCSAALDTVLALRAAVRDTRPGASDDGLAALRRRLHAQGTRVEGASWGTARTGWRAAAAAVLLTAGLGLVWLAVERSGPPGSGETDRAVRTGRSAGDGPRSVLATGLTPVGPEDLSLAFGQPCSDPADCGFPAE